MGVSELMSGLVQTPDIRGGTLVLAGVLVLGITALARSLFLSWQRLRHVPGPFLNSITPLCLTWHCLKEDITVYTHSLAQKYGPLVRISPNVVMFSDPDTFRHICSVKANYARGLWFEFTRWMNLNNRVRSGNRGWCKGSLSFLMESSSGLGVGICSVVGMVVKQKEVSLYR